MTDRMRRRRAYGVVAVGTIGYTCLLFIWVSLPAYLSSIIDELGLSGTQAGVVAGAVPLTYIPIALGTGLVVDRSSSLSPAACCGIATATPDWRGDACRSRPRPTSSAVTGARHEVVAIGRSPEHYWDRWPMLSHE
ncbi:major facilitator superfamily MFS 1 [Natrinema sp. J7-2]|nr:major facilitator superfamily MFS 1 [Natrinema sp. J7-2]